MVQESTTNPASNDTIKTNVITKKTYFDGILEMQISFIISEHFDYIKLVFQEKWHTIKETGNHNKNTKILLQYYNDRIIQDPAVLANALLVYYRRDIS